MTLLPSSTMVNDAMESTYIDCYLHTYFYFAFFSYIINKSQAISTSTYM